MAERERNMCLCGCQSMKQWINSMDRSLSAHGTSAIYFVQCAKGRLCVLRTAQYTSGKTPGRVHQNFHAAVAARTEKDFFIPRFFSLLLQPFFPFSNTEKSHLHVACMRSCRTLLSGITSWRRTSLGFLQRDGDHLSSRGVANSFLPQRFLIFTQFLVRASSSKYSCFLIALCCLCWTLMYFSRSSSKVSSNHASMVDWLIGCCSRFNVALFTSAVTFRLVSFSLV